MKTKKILGAFALLLGLFVLVAFTAPVNQHAPWNIPAKYKTMKNPYAGDVNLANTVGKTLWAKNCKSCQINVRLQYKSGKLPTKLDIKKLLKNRCGLI